MAEAFARALAGHKGLKVVDLSNNRLSEDIQRSLAEVAAKHTTVSALLTETKWKPEPKRACRNCWLG